MIVTNNANNDDQRYAEIYRATISAVGTELYSKYYKNTGNRWLDLAKVWNRCYRKPLHAVFFFVFHKIFWGIYPDIPLDDSFRYLLTLVENEVLTGTESFKAWRRWSIYKNSLITVLDSMESYGAEDIGIHFIEHFQYLSCRTRCKVLRDKQQMLKYQNDLIAYCYYETIISHLIPTSIDWDREKWGDDMNISDAIEDLYGVAYARTEAGQTDFDRIIRLLHFDVSCGQLNSDFYWYAANISELPLKMAKVIWSEDYENVVVTSFVEAYRRTKAYIKAGSPYAWKKAKYINPVGHYEMCALKNSWLTKLILKWLAGGKNFGAQHDMVRRAAFEVQMSV